MVAILSNAIAASDCKKFVISNFPYAEEQAILFEKSVVPPTMVFQFDVSDATMMKNGRLSEANIANYKALAKPMVTKYTRSGQLTQINGDAMVDVVHDDVCARLAAHFTPITTTPAQ
jgi:adenylate kinase family enzyme